MTASAAPSGTHAPPTPPVPPSPPGRFTTAATFALVLVLALLLTVWGAFLVPLRVGGAIVPVSWVIAVVGNVVLGVQGGRLLGKAGAVAPALLWLGVAFTLGSKRAEGDLVVPGSTSGIVFLLAGAVGGAIAYGVQVTRLPPR
ncbi:MAG: hypothetical protein JWN08_2570 [Frankiales bacterium]|nr:hypothetical protein [Frankiales bacterium]